MGDGNGCGNRIPKIPRPSNTMIRGYLMDPRFTEPTIAPLRDTPVGEIKGGEARIRGFFFGSVSVFLVSRSLRDLCAGLLCGGAWYDS